MSQFWIVAETGYPEDIEHFIKHFNAVKHAKKILMKQEEPEEETIDEFIASIKDGESIDKVVLETNIIIRPITLVDRNKYTVVDPKSIWMALTIGTNSEPSDDDTMFFVHRENAAMRAEQLLKESLMEFKEYIDDTIGVADELEKFSKSFMSTSADENFVYNDELLDEFSIVVEKVKFRDIVD